MIAKYLRRLVGSIAIAGLSFAFAYRAIAQTSGSGAPVLSTGTSVNVGEPSSNLQLSRDELEEDTHHDQIKRYSTAKGAPWTSIINCALSSSRLRRRRTSLSTSPTKTSSMPIAKKELAQKKAIENAPGMPQALAGLMAAAKSLLGGAASALGNAANGGGSPSGSAPASSAGGGSSSNPSGGGGSPSNPNNGGVAGNPNSGSGSSGSPNYTGGVANNPAVGGGSPSNPNAGGGSPANPGSASGLAGSPNSGGGPANNPTLTGGASNNANAGGSPLSNPNSGSSSASNPNNAGGSASNPALNGSAASNTTGAGSAANNPALTGGASSNAKASGASPAGPSAGQRPLDFIPNALNGFVNQFQNGGQNLQNAANAMHEVAQTFEKQWTEPYGGIKQVAAMAAFHGIGGALKYLAPAIKGAAGDAAAAAPGIVVKAKSALTGLAAKLGRAPKNGAPGTLNGAVNAGENAGAETLNGSANAAGETGAGTTNPAATSPGGAGRILAMPPGLVAWR